MLWGPAASNSVNIIRQSDTLLKASVPVMREASLQNGCDILLTSMYQVIDRGGLPIFKSAFAGERYRRPIDDDRFWLYRYKTHFLPAAGAHKDRYWVSPDFHR